jgi:hypothetical protein
MSDERKLGIKLLVGVMLSSLFIHVLARIVL